MRAIVVILVIVVMTTMIMVVMVVLARIMILVIVSLTMVNAYLFREMVPGTTFAFGVLRTSPFGPSRKFICSILHSPAPIGGRVTALPLGKHRLVQMDYLENSSTMG